MPATGIAGRTTPAEPNNERMVSVVAVEGKLPSYFVFQVYWTRNAKG